MVIIYKQKIIKGMDFKTEAMIRRCFHDNSRNDYEKDRI
jgi:hypothetical protein